jgi:hypothetical protein
LKDFLQFLKSVPLTHRASTPVGYTDETDTDEKEIYDRALPTTGRHMFSNNIQQNLKSIGYHDRSSSTPTELNFSNNLSTRVSMTRGDCPPIFK